MTTIFLHSQIPWVDMATTLQSALELSAKTKRDKVVKR